MQKKQLIWKKPLCMTINKEQLERKIVISACSHYIGGGCSVFRPYILSGPGSGKPEYM